MGLLKDFLRIEADRRGALAALRLEAQSQRLQIEEIGAEAKRKRDEVAMIEEGLRRLAEDVARTEEQLLEIESRREDHDREAHERKIEAVRSSLDYDRADGHRISEDFRRVRSAFETERTRLLSEADTGRMMDNFFQIEAFLKDTGTPIPRESPWPSLPSASPTRPNPPARTTSRPSFSTARTRRSSRRSAPASPGPGAKKES